MPYDSYFCANRVNPQTRAKLPLTSSGLVLEPRIRDGHLDAFRVSLPFSWSADRRRSFAQVLFKIGAISAGLSDLLRPRGLMQSGPARSKRLAAVSPRAEDELARVNSTRLAVSPNQIKSSATPGLQAPSARSGAKAQTGRNLSRASSPHTPRRGELIEWRGQSSWVERASARASHGLEQRPETLIGTTRAQLNAGSGHREWDSRASNRPSRESYRLETAPAPAQCGGRSDEKAKRSDARSALPV